ncbi:Heat shock protein HtpX [Snodgrassella alvi wkB2]|uniref:Protease HtpX homolog n=1 Tax=Snodgrassella alvi TaxID=1196083 RepID=A0ABD7Z0V3_9NEIS|nr:protease HtpX [Snodgrassella alvi]AHN28837.1 Heat shock protein HtpX [Snodgrassella alvi wkB2]ORF05019.1 zinc metalloprotease HtpX [Snodgrassella alvi]PIT45730.1 zinc metalloprotease HtpX [Snodgrassella alvi]PIT66122.1 zinc metalloprotease HtpX [Snodgrassella alvi]UOO98097.1 protease HtpX [Snodgrassella alvi wkB2]
MKRIVLFIVTNLAVIIVINVVLNILCALLGINIYSNGNGILLLLAAVVGFTGSIISLIMSKTLALNSVNGQIIGQPQTAAEAWLLNTVASLASQWNIAMPEVAIYDSPEPNAFATGATRNSSLVAVSTGLLHNMSQDELEAVLAHEMAHIGNGDMVTMTLLQGVVNTFVFFWANRIADVVARKEDGEVSHSIYYLVSMILQTVFGFLASLIVMWFSRQREYRADAGAARLVGAPKMIAALQRLKGETSHLPAGMQAFGIASETADALFSTHPTLDNRINRLRQM